jgi:mono/diheme cytochrome c family protein
VSFMSLAPRRGSTQALRLRGAALSPIIHAAFVVLWTAGPSVGTAADLPLKDQPHLRRPIASAWVEHGKLLAVANQRSGSISILDVPQRKVLDEIAVGERLADIAAHPSGHCLLTVDEGRHELILISCKSHEIKVDRRLPVSPYPVSVAISPGGSLAAVASLWSRKVTVFRVTRGGRSSDASLTKTAEISLDFNPRGLAFDGKGKLVVDDAFRPLVTSIDIKTKQVGKLVPRSLQPPEPTFPHLLRFADAVVVEVPNGSNTYHSHEQIGLHPSAGGLNDHRGYGGGMPGGGGFEASQGGTLVGSPADRGEQLFYREWMDWTYRAGRSLGSCHSCHINGHTSGQLADTLGDDTTGTPKRILTLLGTRLTDPWAWNGKVRNLNEQVRKSLETTMHVKNVTPQQVDDITAFLHTLPPPPPLEPATNDPADRARLTRGESLFKDLGCAKCHVPPLTYTSPDVYDVSLQDEKGMSKFNPPSLRGVSQGYSFFHDGRAKSLEEVFTAHGHQLDRALADAELADLLRFLRSL